MSLYLEYFGFKTEPFSINIQPKNMLKLPDMVAVKGRLDYALNIGGIILVTGEVGSGKTTSMRWALSHYHPSELQIVEVVANSASLNELYKQLCWSLSLEVKSASRSYLARMIKNAIRDLILSKKQKVLLLIDEASLLRLEILAELHTLTQFEGDATSKFSIALIGQSTLIDKLTYRSSAPLASRVVAKTHLKAITKDQMHDYLNHHTKMAGIKKSLFADDAVTAIHQGSSGLLREANNLARGSMMAAATEGCELITAEHIRIASTELVI
jgi:type II secretory pathway predicted ATPase ExeA